jgi:hypothetical protein
MAKASFQPLQAKNNPVVNSGGVTPCSPKTGRFSLTENGVFVSRRDANARRLEEWKRMKPEVDAAEAEEDSARSEWVERLNSLSDKEVDAQVVYKIAYHMAQREDVRDTTRRLAQAYVEAVQKRKDLDPR